MSELIFFAQQKIIRNLRERFNPEVFKDFYLQNTIGPFMQGKKTCAKYDANYPI